jgi:hypothetical protein
VTPTEMARTILTSIETARAVMEDGPTGYVLHTCDFTQFICRRGAVLRLDTPLSDDVAVLTHASATVTRRFWNTGADDVYHPRLCISLRREALVSYCDRQQLLLDTLIEMGALPQQESAA